jgi:ABC-type multidrug transport system ATPase subunit
MRIIVNILSILLGGMMVEPIKVLFMEEISNGLDSSTTFQIINKSIQILNRTALVSLLQPAPESFPLNSFL